MKILFCLLLSLPLSAQIGIEYFNDFLDGKAFASWPSSSDTLYQHLNTYGDHLGDLYYSPDSKTFFLEREGISNQNLRLPNPKKGWYFYYVPGELLFVIDTRDQAIRDSDPFVEDKDKNCYFVHRNFKCKAKEIAQR